MYIYNCAYFDIFIYIHMKLPTVHTPIDLSLYAYNKSQLSLSSNRGFVVGLWGQGVGFRAEKLRQNCSCNCVLIEPSTGHFTPTAKMHKLFRIATKKRGRYIWYNRALAHARQHLKKRKKTLSSRTKYLRVKLPICEMRTKMGGKEQQRNETNRNESKHLLQPHMIWL